jgi:folate-binding protein YgfZ
MTMEPMETIESIAAGFELLVAGGGAVVVPRDVITVTGVDASRYLQGQLSQDITRLSTSGAWSFILQPTGKVDAWLRVHRITEEEFVLEVEAGFGEVLATRVHRFLIRTKATISEPETRWLVAQRWGSGNANTQSELSDEAIPGALLGMPVGPGVAGVDLLFDSENGARAFVAELAEVPFAALDRYRIAHAVPAMGAELTEDTIPGEAGAWVIEASVSFTKGCYTGQELVARIDSRGGNVPRPIRLLVFTDGCASGEAPAIGEEIRFEDAVVGSITSTCAALGEHLPAMALGPLARSVVIGAVVEVSDGAVVRRAVVTEPPASD